MPRFFFNVRDHIDADDHEGAELPDLAAAKIEAEKDILDIMKSRLTTLGNTWPQLSIEICDSDRKVLLVVPFSKN